MTELTPDERAAIKALKRVAACWPNSLWLFSASGSLNVMRKGADGEHVQTPSGGVDPAYSVDRIDIENDGGDW
jgi:hypothetical protein